MSDSAQHNGVSELSRAFHRVVKDAISEGIEPVLDLIHESEERLTKRMDALEGHMGKPDGDRGKERSGATRSSTQRDDRSGQANQQERLLSHQIPIPQPFSNHVFHNVRHLVYCVQIADVVPSAKFVDVTL